MSDIGTPVWRPTADCIWNSFRSSGRKHLLLTGRKGSGKSTLFAGLGADRLPGLTSWAEPGRGVWVRERGTDREAQIGAYDARAVGPDRRMRALPSGFEALAIPALARCAQADGEWAALDEIGYLESASPRYCRAILALLDSKRVIAAVRKAEEPFLLSLVGRDDAFTVDLDAPFGRTGCVIMASGLGRRFGGNKLMADFHGQPMLARCLDATQDVPQRVVVTRHEDVAAYCRARNVPVVLHEMPWRSDTVRLGLEALPGVDACMFCPADQPLLSRETVDSLMVCGAAAPDRIWRTACDGMPGAPVLFPGWTFDELRRLPEGKGGGFVAKKYPERVGLVPVRDPYELMDADTPEDLRLLLDR